MCEPTTVMMAASLAIAALSAVQAGEAQKDAADYNAAVAQDEARIAQIQSDQSVQQAASQQVKHDRETALKLGQQRSRLAASGLDMSSGSALSQLADNAGQMEIDRQNIGYQGQLNQWGYKNKANSMLNQAELSKAQGRSALTAGYMSAGASILGAAGQAAGAFTGPAGGKTSILSASGKKTGFYK